MIKNRKIRRQVIYLRFFAKNVIKTFTDKKHAYIAEIEFRAMSIQDGEIKERSNLLYNKLLDLFEKVVAKGIKEKEFKNLDVRKTAMSILAIFQGISWFVVADEKHVTPEEYINDSIELIISSISI